MAKRDMDINSCHAAKVKKNRIILYFCRELNERFIANIL
jgi:hypothetical protein